MKPCPFCGETIQPAAVKCRFCGEWLDPSKRPAWSGQDIAALTEQITREVARQLAPQAAEARPSSPPTAPSGRPPRRRSSTRDIPSDPHMAGVIAPDDSGRAAGSVEFQPRMGVEPMVPPPYEAPGPYPGLPQPHARHGFDEHDREAHDHGRTLGQPAPRGARWQPDAEDSGPAAAAPTWQPPLSEEPSLADQDPAATNSDAVWQAPAWLRPEERPSATTPGYSPSGFEQPAATPTWGAAPQPAAAPQATPAWAPPSPSVEAPVWNPEPEPTAQRARAPRIPELGLDTEPPSTITPARAPALADDDPYVDGGFADEFDDDEFDDGEFDDEPAVARRRAAPEPGPSAARGRKAAAQSPAPEAAALEPELAVGPVSAPAAETRSQPEPPTKPKRKPKGDDDFDDDDFDDDDDDFDDDDDDFDDDSSMAGDIPSGASIAATAQPRKLPWVPIAAVAGALVLLTSWVFRDSLFGGGDDEAGGDEAGELANAEPETPPEPEPEPEPKPEQVEEKPPEPPPPAIPPEELEAKLAEATKLLDRRRTKDASAIVDEILEKIPQEPDAMALRAMIQLNSQKYDDSLVTANECVGVDPNQASCWIVIASVEQLKSNLPRALEGFRKYLELEPEGKHASSAKLGVKQLSAQVEG